MSVTASSARVDVRYEVMAGDRVRCVVDVRDEKLLGKSAELRIRRTVNVKDSRGVNESDVVFETRVASLAPSNAIDIVPSTLKTYTYQGTMIDVTVRTEIEVKDGIIFDTVIEDDDQIRLLTKPAISVDAKGIVEPKDAFSFVANLRAIPAKNQLITMVLCAVAALVVAANTIVGVHDEIAPDPATWFYDHVGSKGKSESPFFKSLSGDGVVGAALWMAIRRQLRKYMTFQLAPMPARICAGDNVVAATLVAGVSRVDLDNVIVRVVASNMEKGQYKRGSGTKERTVSFTEPVRAVILYERQLAHVPRGVPIQQYLDGEIAFEPMFRALYPPQAVSSTHGITIHWEVQLIHPQFVDQELAGPIECFPWEEFLHA